MKSMLTSLLGSYSLDSLLVLKLSGPLSQFRIQLIHELVQNTDMGSTRLYL
jgi:hypothetical protein